MRTRKRKPVEGQDGAAKAAREKAKAEKVSTRVDVTPAEWEAARAAWLYGAGIDGIIRAVPGLNKAEAQALAYVGDRRRGRPPLAEEARAAAMKSDGIQNGMLGAVERMDEQEAARLLELRAKRALEAEQATQQVLEDGGRARVEEARLVRANRLGTMALANANARLLRVVGAFSRGLLEDLVVETPDGDRTSPAVDSLTVKERLGLIRTIAQVVQRTAEASARAVQMERLLMGEPTSIVAHTPGPAADMTPEEAERWIAAAARVHDRRRRPILTVDATVELDPPPTDEQH
jgi:hypothetical protein